MFPLYNPNWAAKKEAENRRHLLVSRLSDEKPTPGIRIGDGTIVDPFNLKPTDLKPLVIINSLCKLNRFHGHSSYPYSVGQHSSNLVRLVPNSLKRAAHIHDFSEVFFNDLASPVKNRFPDYRRAEHKCGEFIAAHFGIEKKHLEALDEFDKRIYVNERNAVFTCIKDRGAGDDLKALSVPRGSEDLFKETSWRRVKHRMIEDWCRLFPEFDIETGERYE